MSRMHSLFVLLCVLGYAQLVLCQNFACNFDGTLGHYDLSSLTGNQINGADSATQWYYFLNMCGMASGTTSYPCSSVSAMACQVYRATPTGNTFAIGYATDQSKPHVWSEITTPFKGVQLVTYGQADTGCPTGYKLTMVQIQCDPTATQAPTTFTSSVVESPKCTYPLQFTHSSACPGAGGGGDDGGGSSGISGGTIFLIVVLVSAFVYVVAGCFYKRYQKGTTGMIESCPNNEFWTAIPGLVKDGCLYTVRKLKSLCGGGGGSTSGGTGSYENI